MKGQAAQSAHGSTDITRKHDQTNFAFFFRIGESGEGGGGVEYKRKPSSCQSFLSELQPLRTPTKIYVLTHTHKL